MNSSYSFSEPSANALFEAIQEYAVHFNLRISGRAVVAIDFEKHNVAVVLITVHGRIDTEIVTAMLSGAEARFRMKFATGLESLEVISQSEARTIETLAEFVFIFSVPL